MIDLSALTGVTFEEALHCVLVMAEDYHHRGLGVGDDRGLNGLCLEIVARRLDGMDETGP